MSITIVYDKSKNSEQNFFYMRGEIVQYAKKSEIPVTEAIDKFINSFKNFDEETYREIIDIEKIPPSVRKELIDYMKDLKREYFQKEKKNSEKEEREAKKVLKKAKKEEIERKINELIFSRNEETELDAMKNILSDINTGKYAFETSKEKRKIVRELEKKICLEEAEIKKITEEKAKEEAKAKRIAEEKAKEEAKAKKIAEEKAEKETKAKAKEEARRLEIQKKVEKNWKEIQYIGEKGYKESGTSESTYWIAIKRKFIEESSNSDSEDVKNQIIELFDEKIIEIEDKEYFNEVKNATNGFASLAFYFPEMMNAMYGTSGRKISSKNMDRFLNLRAELQKSISEYTQIKRLLSEKTTTQGDRRILLARKDVMDKEFEKKRREAGIGR